MKVFLSVLLTVAMLVNSYAQTIRVRSNVGLVVKEANAVSQAKVTTKVPRDFVLAYKTGYVTQGFTAEELAKKNVLEYTFNLQQAVKPVIPKDSKRIKVSGFVDKTEKLGLRTVYGPYGTYRIGIDFEDPKFANAVGNQMHDWGGYNVVGLSNSVFKEKEKSADFAVAGEILAYAQETKGTSGYKIAVIIDWSVYDIVEEKVVLKVSSGGYSDSQKGIPYADEFEMALKDAAMQLIVDPEFVKLASDAAPATGDNKALLQTLTLPKISPVVYSSSEAMLEASIKSVVTIKTEFGHGSGFLISANGYILTNSHVVNGSDKAVAIFSNGLELPVTLVSENKLRDVALMKVVGGGYTPLPISAVAAKVGSDVIAIGTPEDLKLGQSVTKGIISGNRIFKEKNYIQTDVSINSGNSGGALLNSKGEVVGIIAAKVKATGVEGLGFAIPIGEALTELKIKFE